MVQHDQINVDAGAEELIHELTDGICYLPEVCCFDPNRHIVVAACSHILRLPESCKLQQTSTATLGKLQRLSQEIP